jgi:predicted transcriptional regulator
MENNQEILKEVKNTVEGILADAKKSMATPDQVEAVKAEIATLKAADKSGEMAESIKGLNAKLESVEKSIAEMSDRVKTYSAPKETTKEQVLKAIEKASKDLGENRSGMVKIKTVGDISITSNVTGSIYSSEVMPGWNAIPKQSLIIEGLADTGFFQTGKSTAVWLEESSPAGGADMTAEGTTKTQYDTNIVEATAVAKKVTSYITVTKEFKDDYAEILREIENNLLYKLAKKKDEQYYNGTGATVYINGITKSGYAQPLDLASLANTFALNKSNRWDAVAAAITQIETNMLGMSMPNAILLSPADYYKMVFGTKTTTNEYDVLNRLVTVTDPLGHTTRYA